MKDLMQITCLVPTKKVREIAVWLEDNGAVSMMVKAFRNGEAPVANGKAAAAPRQGPGETQIDWITRHVKKEMEITELHDAFAKAGYRYDSFWGAVNNAATKKMIKRVRPGVYRPVA